MIEIREATTETEFQQVGELHHEFMGWLRETYPEIIHLMEDFFTRVEADIKSFPGAYAPPSGALLLATDEGKPVGTVGLADLGEKQCEMMRLYVNPKARGKKIGFVLARELIAAARNIGYLQMRLNTGRRHYAAISLYQSLGFVEINQEINEANANPDVPYDLKKGIISMALKL